MKPVTKAFSIAVAISLILFGYIAAININGMPDWYYGSMFFLPFFLGMWSVIHSCIRIKNNTNHPAKDPKSK